MLLIAASVVTCRDGMRNNNMQCWNASLNSPLKVMAPINMLLFRHWVEWMFEEISKCKNGQYKMKQTLRSTSCISSSSLYYSAYTSHDTTWHVGFKLDIFFVWFTQIHKSNHASRSYFSSFRRFWVLTSVHAHTMHRCTAAAQCCAYLPLGVVSETRTLLVLVLFISTKY